MSRRTPPLRKHLSADALIHLVRSRLARLPDVRPPDVTISLTDALMSAFALFSLKDPSLLAFDRRRGEDNLRSLFGLENVPCDTQMRTILDEVPPENLRPAFRDVFRQLQRGKALEPLVYYQGCYLLSIDGTGYFSSSTIHCASCLEVTHRSGQVTYSHQLLGGAIVHPAFREVIPLAPEPIIRQDGETKNDCERNAAKRFLRQVRQDHAHLPLIVVEDGLSSNAPHIRELQRHHMHYILVVQEGDHTFLFDQIAAAVTTGQAKVLTLEEAKTGVLHHFRYVNGVPLNEANQDLLVNVIEYWEIRDGAVHHWCWITDFRVVDENVFLLMRGGRSRWKIENETFNTLKNQGYHFEHNYGHGQKHLSVVFASLMMLAFLVDQVQQLCCPLFRAAWKKWGSKRLLWDRLRSLFFAFVFCSMQELYEALLYGFEKSSPILLSDSS
jgi:hypothetical protein